MFIRIIQKAVIVLMVLALTLVVSLYNRDMLMYQIMKLGGSESPPLELRTTEGPNTQWYDDDYTIEKIAEGTWAIGEPRYYQQN
jgi:hypothetical protein